MYNHSPSGQGELCILHLIFDLSSGGNNTIRLIVNAGSAGANVDKMDIKWIGKEIKNPLEAENATLNGGVVVKSSVSGYEGTGFADFPDVQGTNVNIVWTFSESEATIKSVNFSIC